MLVTVTAEPPKLGAEANVKVALALVAVVLNAEAFGAVLTRKIESLFNVTKVVPAVFADAASLGM
jgi:hypothetical protein